MREPSRHEMVPESTSWPQITLHKGKPDPIEARVAALARPVNRKGSGLLRGLTLVLNMISWPAHSATPRREPSLGVPVNPTVWREGTG